MLQVASTKLRALTRITLLLASLGTLISCTPTPEEPIKIGLNPWPGYEFLYLAEELGYYDAVNANIRIVQMSSLNDLLKAYTHGRIDGLTSTIVEAVQAEHMGGLPLSIILVSDYSNGGDVIISSKEVAHLSELKNKRIGAEISSLGLYITHRALAKQNLSLEDITIVNAEQEDGGQLLESGDINAFVSYPPTSIRLLKNPNYHVIFDSSDIPYEILDTLSLSQKVLAQQPELPSKIHKAWNMALQYTKENPEHAYKLMAQREHITVAEFKNSLNDLKILTRQEQLELFQDTEKLIKTTKAVCSTLVHSNAINTDCKQQKPIFWQGQI